MRPAAARTANGFTLVEVALSVAIAITAAAVIVLLYGSVSRYVASQRLRVGSVADAERALASIRDDAARALMQEEDLACVFSLARAPESPVLSLCATRAGEGNDGIAWARTASVQYRAILTDSGDLSLVAIERPLTGPGSLAPPSTNVLIPRLAGFAVQVFDGATWHDAWPPEGGKATPRMIRASISPAGEAGERSVSGDFVISSGIVVTSSTVRATAATD